MTYKSEYFKPGESLMHDLWIDRITKEEKLFNEMKNSEELKTDLGDAYEKMRNKHDNVHKPAHYQGKVECIDAIESAVEGLEGIEAVCTANVIKYVWRYKRKNHCEDLRKGLWYLNKLIEINENKS